MLQCSSLSGRILNTSHLTYSCFVPFIDPALSAEYPFSPWHSMHSVPDNSSAGEVHTPKDLPRTRLCGSGNDKARIDHHEAHIVVEVQSLEDACDIRRRKRMRIH
jgi:hypothetical protein